jgi:hypothetical protein
MGLAALWTQLFDFQKGPNPWDICNQGAPMGCFPVCCLFLAKKIELQFATVLESGSIFRDFPIFSG